MTKLQEINRLISRAHNASVARGWWDTPSPNVLKLALIFSEVGEAIEHRGYGTKDDKLTDHDGYLVELADVAIRAADLAGRIQTVMEVAYPSPADLNAAHELLESSRVREGKIAKISYAELLICLVSHALERDRRGDEPGVYRALLAILITLLNDNQNALDPIIEAKMVFNETRQDHSKEARAATGGKRY